MGDERQLQRGFSEHYAAAVFDGRMRTKKARKAICVLEDYGQRSADVVLLDIGCSTGFATKTFAERYRQVIGVDIDEPAVAFAATHNSEANVTYAVMDSQMLAFPDGSFDIVTCAHVYEHVPDAGRLMSEIYRVLKVGGICFFTAGNRIALVEPHYRLPLLSLLPKRLANYYLRILKRGNAYYETHLTYWGLKRLVSKFDITDYTVRVVRDPARFSATEVVKPGSIKQILASAVLRVAYWICPTYIWLLRKVK